MKYPCRMVNNRQPGVGFRLRYKDLTESADEAKRTIEQWPGPLAHNPIYYG